jgi:hypothetical protein
MIAASSYCRSPPGLVLAEGTAFPPKRRLKSISPTSDGIHDNYDLQRVPRVMVPASGLFVGHKVLTNHQHKPAAFTYLGILNPSVGIRKLPPGYCSPGREPKNNRT